MKSFSKRVASFAMAAAMVFSLVAVSPADAEAASKYSLSKKSSITAGKTYTYKVKGVSKNQYIKVKMSSGVTVKYGSKKVKYNSTKITGGKTLSLKVKAADKVANYKATLKAIVYNKKNNKRVKGLTTTTKVKCTKLAIKSVEPATLIGNNGYKYIVVNFNRALDKLDASEVSIRNKSTNELITLEKVALSTNGKSATLTLLGDVATSGNMFVVANTDYVLTVSVKGASAAMDFNFPDVRADKTVTAVDAAKRTITTETGTYTVPTTISVDFQDILGRTVTYWFNKNNEITKLVVANETVVYGAFGVSDKDGAREFAAKTSDAKYVSVTAKTTGTIYHTEYVKATGKGKANIPDDKSTLDYAKLVLNPNGTIRSAVYEGTMISNSILVASVAENVATESKTKSVNLKDYTIVKDGKTIAIANIQAGDVLFYNAGDKYAEVYTTKVTGAVTAVTDKKVTVADKAYEYNAATTKYVEGNETKFTNADYFVAVKKAAKDATLYLDRAGKVVYASGDKGTVATSTRDIILTDVAKTYSQSLESYIRLAGSDATTTAVPEIKLSELKTVKTSVGTWTKDNVTGATKVKSFDAFVAANPNGNPADYTLKSITYTDDKTGESGKPINFKPVEADIVVLTLDSTNTKVIGIELVSAADTLKTDSKTTFEKGKSTIAGNSANYQIVSSTPVYEITKNAASVTKTTYGEYAKKTLADKAANVKIFNDNGNVKKIVINDKQGDTYGITDTDKKIGIVVGKETLNKKVVSFTIISAGQKVEFTSFVDDYRTDYEVGDMVEVEYEKSTNKVKAISGSNESAISTNSVSTNSAKEATNKAVVVNGKIAGKDLAASISPTIVQVNNDGSAKVIMYGELSDLVSTTSGDNYVEIIYHQMVTDVIDYAVVRVKSTK